MRVLDLGGAAGHHFFDTRIKFPEVSLTWAVLETAGMVDAAKPLETDGLRYFAEAGAALAWLGGVDLVHASGVLQCLGDPVPLLNKLGETGAESMIFSRTMCFRDGPVVAIQSSRLVDHGPGPAPAGTEDSKVLTPVVLRSRDTYVAALASRYSLRARWPDHSASDILDGETLTSQALLFRRVA